MSASMIGIETLTDGEIIALKAIEITTIPDVSIIDNEIRDIKIVNSYKSDMSSLLTEVYQIFKAKSNESNCAKDVSLEFLWKTTPVANQPYKAKISLFLILRAIDFDDSIAVGLVDSIMNICESSLDLQKYEYKEISNQYLSSVVEQIDDDSIKAIVKEERIENLQNQLLPFCFGYDQFAPSENDLSRIVNALINCPDSAYSCQIIPVFFNGDEISEINRITQMLDTLYKGITDQSIGNISFTLAEKQAALYKYYSEQKNNALFLFNILVYGSRENASNISTKVYGQLNSNQVQSTGLKVIDLDKNLVNKNNNFYPLPWAVNEQLMNMDRNAQIWNSNSFSGSYYRLPYIITAEEASEFFRLPIGSTKVKAGLNVNESSKDRKAYSDNIINSGDIEVGKLKSSVNDTIGFSLKDLAKHMLVVGTPGSGKTTFSVSLLDRLWKEHNIPFLVIEPAKNEYRALVQSIPDLQVFTPGKNFISPFVFNPFVLPKNVKLETYKSTLKTAFAAGVSMTTPLDKIFEEAINNCYSDFRWLDTYTTDNKGKIFNITDFVRCFQNTFDEIGYTGDAKNIGRAGVVRLNSLVNLFDNYYSIPIEDLLSKPTVIELAAIENSDQKSLIIALLLLSILSYVNANYIGEGGLKNVILLEEAHVLLDADSNKSEGESNPSAIAQGLVKRMLAEIRSYGVGLVIADQSPRKVGMDVVALTDMKLSFRLVEAQDKQIIADSTNMSETQLQRLSKLRPGEAFLFFNKLDEPEEVITPDYRLDNNIGITLSDEGIKSLSTYWNDKADKLRPYPECSTTPYCSKTCDFSRRLLAKEVARRIFVHNFKSDSKDFNIVKKVFSKISALIKDELNDEKFTPELLSCVKVHLWRRIKYGTKIPVTNSLINNSISKK